jgi:NAD(P)-dependent dehydrogenase (short-subunit alcohol dehydrogenase family)
MDRIDILVNNAGYLVKKPASELSFEDSRRMLNVNLLVPLVLIRSLMPRIMKSASPHVLNIGSMAGVQGGKKFPGLSVYSASKAGIHVLTECLAEEYGEKGVRFNALALGAVQTEMFTEAFPGLVAHLKPSEMAEWICSFAVDGQRYFNGKILPVTISTP